MKLTNLDHFVLTVANLDRSITFYRYILNLSLIETNNGSVNFKIGTSLIKLRPLTNDSNSIVARNLVPGAFDFCLQTNTPLTEVQNELKQKQIPIELGPVIRHGVNGAMKSIYLRDPDQNLVEICSYVPVS